MFYVVFSLLLFVSSVVVHIFYCRHTSKPGLHTKAFILIALLSLGIDGAVAWVVNQQSLFEPHSLWGLPLIMTSMVIFVLLVPSYLSFYVLTQLMSPSKKILLSM